MSPHLICLGWHFQSLLWPATLQTWSRSWPKKGSWVSAQTYQVGAHFAALIDGILMAPLKTIGWFFCILTFPTGLWNRPPNSNVIHCMRDGDRFVNKAHSKGAWTGNRQHHVQKQLISGNQERVCQKTNEMSLSVWLQTLIALPGLFFILFCNPPKIDLNFYGSKQAKMHEGPPSSPKYPSKRPSKCYKGNVQKNQKWTSSHFFSTLKTY